MEDKGYCDECKMHSTVEIEVRNLKEAVCKLETNHKEDVARLDTQQKENSNLIDSRIRENNAIISSGMDKLKMDIHTLFSDHQKLRENVIEIRSIIERSNDRNTIQYTQIIDQVKALVELNKEKERERNSNKKLALGQFIYPLLVAILMGGIGYLIAIISK